MKFVTYPFEPFTIEPNQVTVIGTGSTQLYQKIIATFVNDIDDLKLFGEFDKPLSFTKEVLWIGNPALNEKLDSEFLKAITKQMVIRMEDTEQIAILDAAREMSRLVLQSSFNLDVPMNIKDTVSLDNILKFVGLHVEMPNSSDISGKIESLFKILSEINEKRIIVITDLSHFVDKQDFASLVEQVTSFGLTLLLVEFSETILIDNYRDVRYYYVDKDLVDFR